MGKVLTATSVIVCSHQSGMSTSLTAGQDVLNIDGNAVVVQGSIAHTALLGCANAGGSNKPCTQAETELPGATSTVLTINGTPAVLESANGTTDSVPKGTWSVKTVGQEVLQAD